MNLQYLKWPADTLLFATCEQFTTNKYSLQYNIQSNSMQLATIKINHGSGGGGKGEQVEAHASILHVQPVL